MVHEGGGMVMPVPHTVRQVQVVQIYYYYRGDSILISRQHRTLLAQLESMGARPGNVLVSETSITVPVV
jgi:hypothetical protein